MNHRALLLQAAREWVKEQIASEKNVLSHEFLYAAEEAWELAALEHWPYPKQWVPVDPVVSKIAARDGWTCRYCGVKLVPRLGYRPPPAGYEFPTIDHLIPRSRGGPKKKQTNLCLACEPCNQKKKDMTEEEFRAKYGKEDGLIIEHPEHLPRKRVRVQVNAKKKPPA